MVLDWFCFLNILIYRGSVFEINFRLIFLYKFNISGDFNVFLRVNGIVIFI